MTRANFQIELVSRRNDMRLRLMLGTTQTLMDGVAVEHLLRRISLCRAKMGPAIEHAVSPLQEYKVQIDPCWNLQPASDGSSMVLLLRHNSYGWAGFSFGDEFLGGFCQLLAQAGRQPETGRPVPYVSVQPLPEENETGSGKIDSMRKSGAAAARSECALQFLGVMLGTTEDGLHCLVLRHGSSEAVLSAVQTDQLIDALSQAREQVLPCVSAHPGCDEQYVLENEPLWHVAPSDGVQDGILLFLRHSGLGWPGYLFSTNSAERMYQTILTMGASRVNQAGYAL